MAFASNSVRFFVLLQLLPCLPGTHNTPVYLRSQLAALARSPDVLPEHLRRVDYLELRLTAETLNNNYVILCLLPRQGAAD